MASLPNGRFAPLRYHRWRRGVANCCGMPARARDQSRSNGCFATRRTGPSRAGAGAAPPSRIARNALLLGVPHLEIITGTAPEVFANLPRPNAIFIGGGASNTHLLDKAFAVLPQGGRLV